MDASEHSDTLLSEAEVATALESQPRWVRDGDTIVRSVRAATYLDGIGLVDAVAAAAEAAGHHPDITIRWREVTFTLSTHSAGGLTAKDFGLAATIDELAAGIDD
ncbi:4a-hydroxytetrahydrobiopterin dehydratase [Mumia zhuanghuii]|uniref:Putative pterin-4-alpha-carbinolamine dehydratase n=2 Tax=Mumia TaxID=1546255 RepID=A0ABW1QHI5_9ACTN|nr:MULTISPECIES: 4a-hydroxytetrahydrobiopterin dehydratase [Mumia]KAA1422689.1 4a-hydroxytetrahydrobiopterin dehydratase [Mumia zhuanghuii]